MKTLLKQRLPIKLRRRIKSLLHLRLPLRWMQWTLGARLALVMTLLVTLATAGVTVLSFQREQANLRSEMEEQASLLLHNLRVSSTNSLLNPNTALLQELVENVSRSQFGITARIYNAQGRLIADSAEGDDRLAARIDPNSFGAQLLNISDVFLNWQPSYLEAGLPVIEKGQTIGAVSLTLPVDRLNNKIVGVWQQGIVVVIFAALGGAAFSLLISRTITNPLRELTEATRYIAGGDLDYKLELRSRDEFGELAESFNKMTVRLNDLIERLTERATELQRANDRAKEASRLKSEFLATMSHELRTPLNAIIGFSDMLLMGMSGPLNEAQEHKITRLQENGRRLLNLVNDVLDIARIEAGRTELVIEPFSPKEMAERVSSQMTILAESKGLEFITRIDQQLPPALMGDEKRLEQIIVNLISNAVKFTETGRVTLVISMLTEVKAWEIVVADTGIGIPPHAVDLIFDEFRQVDGTSTRAYKGTGLGLAITRHLVTMMRGQIKVESELGAGSRFIVTLPMTQPSAQTSEPLLELERV
jgi:signal transduction histidine kinase